MPSYGEYSPKCALCGQTSRQSTLLSTTIGGAPGLDCRPAELREPDIERCPHCGYCAPCIEDGDPTLQDLVTSSSYRSRLETSEFPEAANSHLCWSFINESQEDLLAAAFACVRAAWVCDDVSFDAGARDCRLKAVALFRKAHEKGQSFAGQKGAEEALLADLLRRSGEFRSALELCEMGLKRSPDMVVSRVLRFEEMLIKRDDLGAHTIAEAMSHFDGSV